jgi:hypothetical protein
VGEVTIIRGHILPKPGGTLALEAPGAPTDPLATACEVLTRSTPLLTPTRADLHIYERDADGAVRGRRGVRLEEVLTADSLTAWWRTHAGANEVLESLHISKATYRIPPGIEAFELGYAVHGREHVQVVQDSSGAWLDPSDYAMPSEFPVTVTLTDATMGWLSFHVHWSPWVVGGNPLSALFERVIAGFVDAGWQITFRGSQWRDDMQEHYRSQDAEPEPASESD